MFFPQGQGLIFTCAGKDTLVAKALEGDSGHLDDFLCDLAENTENCEP